MQNAANSSTVPRRRIGTCCSILARTSGSSAARWPQELGEVHEVGAQGVDLHAVAGDLVGDVAHQMVGRGAGGRVQRRARRGSGPGGAGDDQHLAVALLDHHRHDRPEEVVRRLEAAPHHLGQVVGRRLQEPAGDDPAGEGGGARRCDRSGPGRRRPGARRRLRVGQVADAGRRPRPPRRARRARRPVRPAGSPITRSWPRSASRRAIGGPDVERRVGDQCDPSAAVGHGASARRYALPLVAPRSTLLLTPTLSNVPGRRSPNQISPLDDASGAPRVRSGCGVGETGRGR